MPIVINTTRTTRAAPIIPTFNGTYDAQELRPFEGRPGSMQAHALPSRRDNLLRWPDGRITTLEGAPAVEKDHAYALPVIPTRHQIATAAKSKAKDLKDAERRMRRANMGPKDGAAVPTDYIY